MPRKVGISVVLTTEQIDYLEEQDGSMSETVRSAIDAYKDE